MSRGTVQPPVVTRSGTDKIAAPRPIQTAGAVIAPVCSQFSGDITVTPGPVGG